MVQLKILPSQELVVVINLCRPVINRKPINRPNQLAAADMWTVTMDTTHLGRDPPVVAPGVKGQMVFLVEQAFGVVTCHRINTVLAHAQYPSYGNHM